MTAIEILSGILVILGSLSIIVGLLGVYRMPDFYTRLHAASVIDTLGTILILFGLILYAGLNIVSIKLLLIFQQQWCSDTLQHFKRTKFIRIKIWMIE